MRKIVSLSGLLLFVCGAAWSQAKTSEVKIRAILVDNDLNQKPSPTPNACIFPWPKRSRSPARGKNRFRRQR